MIMSLEPELRHRLPPTDTAGNPTAQELDADLAAAVRRTALARRLFYTAVLAIALYGTATGVAARFDLPWPVVVGGTVALELGGVVFLSNAETRRRLGEAATASRLLGAVVAGAAATFNALGHPSGLLGGFFALMSALGFAAWWLDAENKRRDRLRAHGQLAATTPSYELCGHWLRHPVITRRARSLAKAHPQLGLYGSLEAATADIRRHKRNAALTAALRKRIRAAVDPDMAQIAVLTFDLDQVAQRLRHHADYDGLSALLGAELTAERILHGRAGHAAQTVRDWLADRPAVSPPPEPTAHDGGRLRDRERLAPQRAEAGDGIRADSAAAARAPGSNQTAAQMNADAPFRHDRTAARLGDTDPRSRNGSPVGLNTIAPAGLADPAAASPTLDHHEEQRAADAPAAGQPAPADRAEPAVSVQIVGVPALLDADHQPVRGLRTKSIELLVYLAVHRHGASHADIAAAIWPQVSAERAGQRLSTCLANLRGVIRRLRQSTTAERGTSSVDPVLYAAGRYGLNANVVTVDWWRIVDGYAHTAGTGTERIGRQQAAARIADGSDYPWIGAARLQAYQRPGQNG